jgi:protein-L-isoaspartate(D-aspartate) O-methyltransferase
MNFEIARHNMIEQQIRPWNIIDPIALNALEAIPRENYVPEVFKHSAFSDVQLPIGHNQVMLFPKIEAKILQAVQLQKTDNVLEIGTGSGYMTALLAHLAETVETIELHSTLSQQAEIILQAEGFNNIQFIIADAFNDTAAIADDNHQKYHVIILTAGLPQLPEKFKQQLHIGGRLFAVIGLAPVMEATLITRVSADQYSYEVLFETEFPQFENCHHSLPFQL